MNHSIVYRKRLVLLSALMCAASLSSVARAQELIVPPQVAPPPMVYIPQEERTQLLSARDEKTRTRLSLELAEARLAHAEQQTALKQFNAATADLGVYQALMEDAIEHLYRAGDGGSRSRDLFKRIEQALHKHAARIEAMRRATPGEFAGNVLALIKLTRELRTEALDAFYSDSVVR
ncbi:MAG TPA: hypothetical protein VGX24_01330 [Pyrinomonadaceae bacterium]|jgi:hypothetical protein|nr:hypothetical protein [Pyrinomonadaceae bacterium]